MTTITIPRHNLARIAQLWRASDHKARSSVALLGIHIRTDGDKIVLSCTSGRILAMVSATGGFVDGDPVNVLVNAALFCDAIKGIQTSDATLTVEAKSITIAGSHSATTLPLMDGTFPSLDGVMLPLLRTDKTQWQHCTMALDDRLMRIAREIVACKTAMLYRKCEGSCGAWYQDGETLILIMPIATGGTDGKAIDASAFSFLPVVAPVTA